MFSFFKKKNTQPQFDINTPKLSITPYTVNIEAALKNAGVEYETVTSGYIVFKGFVFESEIQLMIGIHFNALKIEYIEIFRTLEYYQSEAYDVNVSFSELSQMLQNKYGKPLITTAASISGYPCEQWRTPDYIVNHYIMDRFGPEEHLHINFYEK